MTATQELNKAVKEAEYALIKMPYMKILDSPYACVNGQQRIYYKDANGKYYYTIYKGT